MQKITDTLVGGSGIGAVELMQHSGLADISDGSNVISVAIQIIIGIVTLFGLLKRKKI